MKGRWREGTFGWGGERWGCASQGNVVGWLVNGRSRTRGQGVVEDIRLRMKLNERGEHGVNGDAT